MVGVGPHQNLNPEPEPHKYLNIFSDIYFFFNYSMIASVLFPVDTFIRCSVVLNEIFQSTSLNKINRKPIICYFNPEPLSEKGYSLVFNELLMALLTKERIFF
jgi:hypothetical protein